MVKMTYVLGLHGFSARNSRVLHDTGVTIVKDGRIVAAIGEERLSRVKNDGRFPWKSYEKIFEMTNVKAEQIDMVAFPDERPSWQILNIIKYMLKAYAETGVFPKKYLLDSLQRTIDFFRHQPDDLREKPVVFVEHHVAHAASAYYTCPWGQSTVVTLDGMGDYCVGGTVSLGDKGSLRILKRTNGFFSPGIFYMIVTDHLGFKPGRHEGKVTGLAAFGNPHICYHRMKDIIEYRSNLFDFYGVPVLDAIEECSLTKGRKSELRYFEEVWNGFSKEEIAAGCKRHRRIFGMTVEER